ncbi:MAG: 30S ribosomal protein S1 [Planctomycetales bacterium]|nr:30S ribosomal protein S1 [Planctomycetales bacterium]
MTDRSRDLPRLSEADLDKEVREATGGLPDEEVTKLLEAAVGRFQTDRIVNGIVLTIVGDEVVVDVGYKSEGVIPLSEFEHPDELDQGDTVEVLVESVDDEMGLLRLSKRKADRQRGWERIVTKNAEGDTVKGKVVRKIKGGLLVDIGVPAFLPASQVDLRRTGDISDLIGKEVEAEIIKIDQKRSNIVLSRRKLLERQREEKKAKVLAEIEEGKVVKGVVRNIAEFGAFVDIGGIDGLLHVTDMSWGRVNHPSEVVKIDQELELVVLRVDRERERIALGLKQRSPSPWDNVEQRYPIGARVKGTVVNVTTYGAFVRLEDGIEGLVHVSEMSWTRRISHPSEVVKPGDVVEVCVLDLNREKQEMSLGIKQTESNPWEKVEEKYPVGKEVEGVVRTLTNYGAFIELEEGIDGLLHVSDLSWTKKVAHPSEILKKGDPVKAVVLSVDKERKRVALGVKQLSSDPWEGDIPGRFHAGDVIEGTVTKLTNFGAFVEIAPGLEGLLHVSEMSDKKVKGPEEIVQQGTKVKVKVLRVEPADRKIGLSMVGMSKE